MKIILHRTTGTIAIWNVKYAGLKHYMKRWNQMTDHEHRNDKLERCKINENKAMENNVVKSKIEDGKIIDIHNHIFPDKIAEKAVASTGNYYGISMAGKGTVRDLLESGSKIQVSKYIIHSTATKPEQVKL